MLEAEDPVLFWRHGEERLAARGCDWAETKEMGRRVLSHFRDGGALFASLMDVAGRLTDPGTSIAALTRRGHVVGFARPRPPRGPAGDQLVLVGQEHRAGLEDCALAGGLPAARAFVREWAARSGRDPQRWRAYPVEIVAGRDPLAWRALVGHPGRTTVHCQLELAVRVEIADADRVAGRQVA